MHNKFLQSDQIVLSCLLQKKQKPRQHKSTELIGSIEPGTFLGKARSQFRTGKFEEAAMNLDIYLSIENDNAMGYVLRGLSRKLSDSPDVEGSCADLLKASSIGFNVSAIDGIETYCDSQAGWAGR